ncbi:hypothetical protein [Larkinella terrae]|uniref:Uncharacterized protein n=1 Tax=Larkinella terrae TaxID=2025311 RepID=A0A7K0EG44_9BACT|nr:hypothetical protein [Larkinella terrae]MRS60672.1 hypothetical protein [Larkinella terrae]
MKRRPALKTGAMATSLWLASPATEALNVQTFGQKMTTDGSEKTRGWLLRPV